MAVSAQGTTISRGGTLIQQVRNITPPSLQRSSHEVTTFGNVDDRHKVGIREYGDLVFELSFNPADANHMGLIVAWRDATVEQYVLSFSDGATWVFDGWIIRIEPQAPVDGLFASTIAVRPTGTIALAGFLLAENGDQLTTEDGFIISLEA